MARLKLSPEEWDAVRRVWEFDLDEPSHQEAARRAAKKQGFTPPSKQSTAYRARTEGWRRHGTMLGIVEAAQRKADNKGAEGGYAEAIREESENQRADVIARHRAEWAGIIQLRKEATVMRDSDVQESMTKTKLAKLQAEVLTLQQNGERKAWGLDDIVIPDLKSKSDADLKAIISGKIKIK
jgi:hypothetical protein